MSYGIRGGLGEVEREHRYRSTSTMKVLSGGDGAATSSSLYGVSESGGAGGISVADSSGMISLEKIANKDYKKKIKRLAN